MSLVDGTFVLRESARDVSPPRIVPHIAPLPILPVDAARFDADAMDFAEISQEQTATFSASRWPTLPLEPLLFTQDNETVGGALVMLLRLPLQLGTIAVCKWGPMLADQRRPDAAELYRGMVEALIAEYSTRRGMMLSLLPRVSASEVNAHEGILTQRGFVAGRNVPYPKRYVVDLSPDDTTHRAGLNPKWRYHLNKAEKNGLRFVEAGPERFGEFASLYEAMSARKRFPDYSAYHTLPALFAAEPPLRPALFFVHAPDESVVAGAVIFRAGETATYLYGATNEAALPLRAGYLMHWEIIRWLKRNSQARWYDLGGSDGFLGLHQFKKQMVGTAGWIHLLPSIYHYAADKKTLAVGRAAFQLRDLALAARQKLLRPFTHAARPDMKPEPRG